MTDYMASEVVELAPTRTTHGEPMRSIVILSLFSLVLGCGGGEEAAPPPPPKAKAKATPAPPPPPKAFVAKDAFNTTCATCHGEDGSGNGPAGAALDPKPSDFGLPVFWETRDHDHIVEVITKGGAAVGKSPLMVSFAGQYNADQIQKLANHVESFNPNAKPVVKKKAVDNAADGKADGKAGN